MKTGSFLLLPELRRLRAMDNAKFFLVALTLFGRSLPIVRAHFSQAHTPWESVSRAPKRCEMWKGKLFDTHTQTPSLTWSRFSAVFFLQSQITKTFTINTHCMRVWSSSRVCLFLISRAVRTSHYRCMYSFSKQHLRFDLTSSSMSS